MAKPVSGDDEMDWDGESEEEEDEPDVPMSSEPSEEALPKVQHLYSTLPTAEEDEKAAGDSATGSGSPHQLPAVATTVSTDPELLTTDGKTEPEEGSSRPVTKPFELLPGIPLHPAGLCVIVNCPGKDFNGCTATIIRQLEPDGTAAVSYTHLTLPTNREV